MSYQPQTLAGFDLLGPQQPLDTKGIAWIGKAQEWATGVRGIALYTDERRCDFHLLLFLPPSQARAAWAFLDAFKHRRLANGEAEENSSKEDPC